MVNNQELVDSLYREIEELKSALKPFIYAGSYWSNSGGDDDREVRIAVKIGWLRDAERMVE